MSDRYAAVAAHVGRFPVRLMCDALGVSVSGFNAARRRAARPPAARAAADERLRVAVGAGVKGCVDPDADRLVAVVAAAGRGETLLADDQLERLYSSSKAILKRCQDYASRAAQARHAARTGGSSPSRSVRGAVRPHHPHVHDAMPTLPSATFATSPATPPSSSSTTSPPAPRTSSSSSTSAATRPPTSPAASTGRRAATAASKSGGCGS